MKQWIIPCSVGLAAAAFCSLGLLLAADSPARGVKPAFASEVSVRVDGGYRLIRSNGIPQHDTGQFPGKGNPNTIAPQHYEFRVPANPKIADKTTPLFMQPFGVAINGVVFDPGAAEWWNRDRNSGWQYEPLAGEGILGIDHSHAHVQPNGAYHYHGLPTGLLWSLTDGKEKIALLGWAADGFPMYSPVGHADPKDAGSGLKKLKSSYQVKKGTRPSGPGGAYDGTFVADYEYVAGSGDLDECNGRVAVTPEYPQGIYQYVLTEEFPFVPRMYRGTPDASFNTHGPRGGAGGGPGEPGGGPGGGPGGPGDGPRRPIPAIVRALDADGDGVISAEEMANAVAALKKLDKNGDGKLTPDEYLGPRPGGGGGGGGPRGGGEGPGKGPAPER